jgi:hypothetical protein
MWVQQSFPIVCQFHASNRWIVIKQRSEIIEAQEAIANRGINGASRGGT